MSLPDPPQNGVALRQTRWRAFRAELAPTLALAGPVIAAELGWMAMGIVDTIVVGRLGPEAIGAVSIGSVLYISVAVVGMGLLLGLDAMVAQAFGAGHRADCHRSLLHGIYVALLLAPPTCAVVWAGSFLLHRIGIQHAVLELTIPYLRVLNWGTLPLLLYAAVRRYLQAIGLVKPVMFALVSANAVNLAANWILVYGHLGAPVLGVVGSSWATSLARLYLCASLLGTLLVHAWFKDRELFRVPLAIDWLRMRKLLALGLPAAGQVGLEVGVFGIATALAGHFAAVDLAAHQVVLNTASLTFMVPLGVASAAAVRVGHAMGRHEGTKAQRAGWTALALGAGFMACSAALFLLFPNTILGIYTDDPEVLSTGRRLLVLAALFQIFDGAQVVATGALRGTGETRTPMFLSTAAHWCLGLPAGYTLAFLAGQGVFGLWVGLTIGLIAAGVLLLRAWAVKSRTFSSEPEEPTAE